jgi:hypothetical protein
LRRSTSATRNALLALAVALAAVGCGSGGRRSHDALERALLKTSVSICNGACKHYALADARCVSHSAMIGGRRWRRCLMIYADGGPREYVCAALANDEVGYDVREQRECRR